MIPYFERFLARFPDVHALAAAAPDDVLRLWEGLGYYSRARNLHRAARTIVTDCNGQFPRSTQALQLLPGIGRYTAGAIASFAFGIPAPVVEANTLRLYSRLLSLEIDPRSAAGQRTIWRFAEWLVTSIGGRTMCPGDLNQALMDLGSTVCRPTEPLCHVCPLTRCCRAFQRATQQTVPIRAARIAISDVTEISVAIRKTGRFLVRQHVPPERWPGLWDFVRFPVVADDAVGLRFPPHPPSRSALKRASDRQLPFVHDDLNVAVAHGTFDSAGASAVTDCGGQSLPTAWTDQIRSATGLTVQQVSPVCELRHTVTRYRIRLLCLIAVTATGRIPAGSGYHWMHLNQLAELPLSMTCRRFVQRLQSERPSSR